MRLQPPAKPLRLAAVLYVGLVAAGALAHALTDGHRGQLVVLCLLTLPGLLFMTVLVLASTALFGPGDLSVEEGHHFGTVAYAVGGALFNVLIVWALLRLVRAYAEECRARRRKAGAPRPGSAA